MIPAKVLFLGTGTSAGVPFIGCRCAVCLSTDPRDKRLRPSIFVDVPGHAKILVDTSTDLRQQALANGVTAVDAVLFTHGHADHVMGFDDIRAFNFMQRRPMPCYASAHTWESLRKTFYYVFDGAPRQGGGIPLVEAHEIDGPFSVHGIRVVPLPLLHGQLPILGFRFGNFAYMTDCSAIPDACWPLLEQVDTLVIDALRYRPHTTHFNVDEALAAVAKIAPRQTYFTHMNHELGYAETSARLPAGVALAYDGLVLDIAADVS